MSNFITLSGAAGNVTIAGLKNVEEVTKAAFDGITVTLSGAEVDSFRDLKISGGASDGNIGVRRIIWSGKVDGVNRNTVLIVDLNSGYLRGGWLLFGDQENRLTYYTDSAKLTANSTGAIDDETAEISLQFVDKKTALTPRTFTFLEKYSLLSIGSSFDHVTINSSLRNDIYLSRSNGSKIISGVIKNNSKATVDAEHWLFEDKNSFVVETSDDGVKFYSGGEK